MIDETSICNLALRGIGAARISDYQSEQSREGRVCRDIFHPVRRWVLVQAGWNGAKKVVKPTQMEDTTPELWEYAFEVPTDLLRVLSVHPSDDIEERTPYELTFQTGAGDDEAKVYSILANAGGTSDGTNTTLHLRYVFNQQDLGALSPGFHMAFKFALQREFAAAIPQTAKDVDLSDKAWKRTLTIAKGIDGQEDYPEKMAEGSWMHMRFGRYGGRSTFSD